MQQTRELKRVNIELEQIVNLYNETYDSVEEQLSAFIDLGKKITGFENGFISKIEGQEYLVLQADTIHNKLKRGDQFSLCDTLCQTIVDRRQTTMFSKLKNTRLYDLAGRRYLNTEAVIGTPLFYEDHLVGTLTFCSLSEKEDEDLMRYYQHVVELLGAQVGKFLRTQRIMDDLADNKRNLEEKLRELHSKKLQLEQRNDELEQFAYATSHDLQEPLRTIVSYIDVLEEEGLEKFEEEEQTYFTFVSQAAQRMKEQIDGLLTHSRIGKQKQIAQVDLATVLAEVKQDLRVAIHESRACIDQTILPTIFGYHTELRLLFQNLISNAIKFAKPGTAPNITVSHQSQQEQWCIEICDNGIGIDQRNTTKIFQLFTRLNPSEQFAGTGIGLTHCKKIVELHQGTIKVTSQLGEGSCFIILLPKKVNAV